MPPYRLFCSASVGLDVVDEDDVFGPYSPLAGNCLMDGAEDSRIGFGHMHLLREEELIEMAVETICTIDEIEMQLISVGEQIDGVTVCAEPVDDIQSPLWQIVEHGHPCVHDLLLSGAGSAVTQHLADEGNGRDVSAFEVGHQLAGGHTDGQHSFAVLVDAEDSLHIRFAHELLKGMHTTEHIEPDEHSSQVEDIYDWFRLRHIRRFEILISLFCPQNYSYISLKKNEMMPVLMISVNIDPMIGTMRKGVGE